MNARDLSTDESLVRRMRRLGRPEYDRMVAAGFFAHERIELLNGVIVRMSPQDFLHSYPIERLTELFVTALGHRGRVRVQLPLALSDDSEPEPDIAIVERRDDLRDHPQSALLIVEVANTSVHEDRVKGRIYASAGIREYWIVDVQRRRVERYSKPADGMYSALTTHDAEETLCPIGFPDVAIPLGEILPPTK